MEFIRREPPVKVGKVASLPCKVQIREAAGDVIIAYGALLDLEGEFRHLLVDGVQFTRGTPLALL